MRGHLLDPDVLVRAVASGRQKGQQPPLEAGRAAVRRPQGRAPPPGHGVRRHPGAHRQPRRSATRRGTPSTTCSTSRSATGTSRPPPRPTRCGSPRSSRRWCTPATARSEVEVDRGHDRDKDRLLPEDDPVLVALGISDADGPDQAEPAGEVPPGRGVPPAARRSRHRRVEKGHLRRPTRRGPAADRRPRLRQRLPDLRRPPVPHRRARAAGAADRRRRARSSPASTTARSPRELGIDADFVVGIDRRRRARPGARGGAGAARLRHRDRRGAGPRGRVAGRRWCWPRPAATTTSPPSCAASATPAPYAMLTRHGILRERFADTLTDALRASLLRLQGYRVDVMQFVESQHTPRNTMLRAVRTGAPVKGGGVRKEYDELVDDLGACGRGWPSCSAHAACVSGRSPAGGRRAVRCSARPAAPADDGERGVPLPGPGDRGVQRAGRRATGCSSPPTTPATPAGSSRSTRRPARPSASPAGRASPRTSRRWRPAGPARSGSATSATTPRSAPSIRSTRVPVGRGATVDAGATYDLAYPDGARRRRGAAGAPARPAGCRRHQGASSAARCTPRPRELGADGPTGCGSSATCCRSPPTGRSSPTAGTSCSATTAGASVYTFPASTRSASSTCPTQQQGEGIAVDDDDGVYVSSEGLQSAGARGRRCPPTLRAAARRRRAERRAVHRRADAELARGQGAARDEEPQRREPCSG